MSSPARANGISPGRKSKRDEFSRLRDGSRSPHQNHYQEPPDASPQQLLQGFSRLLIDQNCSMQKQLNDQLARQELDHKLALADAAAEHDRIRRNAERARERVQLEIEREMKRREIAEVEALNAAKQAHLAEEAEEHRRARELLEKEQRERQRAQTEERELREARARVDEQRKREEVEAAKQKTEKDEAERRESNRKATEDAERATQNTLRSAQPSLSQPAEQAAPTQQASATLIPAQIPTTHPETISRPAQQSAPAGMVDSARQREALHTRYIHLHKELKKMREYIVTEAKKDPDLKNRLGDWRREIVKSMGQLTVDKAMNKNPINKISNVLRQSLTYAHPTIDVSSYMIAQTPPNGPVQLSGVFVYLLNIFSKSVISQFISEASVSSKAADPIGVVAVSIFANAAYKVGETVSLIDILLAKLHVTCPVLWGIYGDQKTPAGRKRIGWWQEGGTWVGEQRHIERMTGLAAGYAALSLRDFSKSRNINPFPNTEYWHALSHIVNTPADQVQPTHFIVLKALVDGYAPRFIGFYGMAALAALRFALVDFPTKAPGLTAANQVRILPEVMKRDLRLTL